MCDCKAKLMGTGILFYLTAKFASKNSFLLYAQAHPLMRDGRVNRARNKSLPIAESQTLAGPV